MHVVKSTVQWKNIRTYLGFNCIIASISLNQCTNNECDIPCFIHDGNTEVTVLEDLKNGAVVQGIVPSQPVEIVSVDWIGQQAVNLVYRVPGGSVAETTLYRDDEHRLSVETRGHAWSFDADGALLRLVTEANRNTRDWSPWAAITPDGPTTAAAAFGTGQSAIRSRAGIRRA